ncbi:unnamed protein product [Prunus armeniaca]
MVHGLPQFKSPSTVCANCMIGKQHKDSIPKKSNWRATEKLQLVHADLCGPISPISNSKKRYIICFIDDFTRKAWTYFLVEKSEALSMFKHFKSYVEKEVGGYIKCLRTDRGGEFTSLEFNEFCIEHGIKRQLTAVYTPQQNRVVERKNRTVMNMVRCILSEKKIPKTFWSEAVNWTTYVLNRSPTLVIKNQTPEEAWSGNTPSIEHFRVFGCVPHVHISDVKKESKAYRLYDPIAKKVVISRDVVFEEDKSWDWDRSYEEHIMADLEWDDEGENEAVNAENDGAVSGEKEGVIAESVGSPQTGENGRESSNSDERRDRRPPGWMRDYVSGERLSEEEDTNVNLALFA